MLDSIITELACSKGDTRAERSCVGRYTMLAKPGEGCFSVKTPQFANTKNFDYRLKRTSSCRNKASDGGNIGCRYTPKMLSMLKLAHELRKKGIIEF